MNDGLPSNYDAWRLASPYDDEKCTCDKCEEEVTDEKLFETSNGDYYCERCAEDYQTCSSCGCAIVSSDYDHEELCDSCVDKRVDRIESNKGETY